MGAKYITPLRELRRWHETVDGAVRRSLRMTKTRFCRLLTTSQTSSLSETVEYDVDELEGRLDRLTRSSVIVGRTRSIRSACFRTIGRTSTDGSERASSRVESWTSM